MELGLGMFGDIGFDNKKQAFLPTERRLIELIEEVKLADKLGFDVFAMGEHHRADYAVSSPEIILAALATITSRIKLSSGVTVLSSSDPVKVFQNFATIDLLSGGRAEIMPGRGSFTESFPLFGYDLQDYDALFAEKLELLLKLNEERIITWEGKFRASLKEQEIFPRPLNNRQLPIWIAVGGTPESVRRAARLGVPVVFAIIGGMPRQFKPLIDFYKQEYLRFGHNENEMQIGVHAHTFLSESVQAVENDYFPYYAAQMDRVGRSRGWPPYTRDQFLGGMSKDGALLMGEPQQVFEKISAMKDLFGITRFVAHMDVGAPPHKAMMKSIGLFGEHVIGKLG